MVRPARYVAYDAVSDLDRVAAELNEVVKVRGKSIQICLFELAALTTIRVTIHSDRALNMALIAEDEWRRSEDDNSMWQTECDGALVSSGGSRHLKMSWQVPESGLHM
jgi:D-alanyl-D-alanine dipeptidase